MNQPSLSLELFPRTYAVARLDPTGKVPSWAFAGSLCSVTRTQEEMSIICVEDAVPPDIQAQRGFRCLRVVGTLDFTEVGVLNSLAQPLADAGVSILALSTYDTDYLLLPAADLEQSLNALLEAGHSIRRPRAD